MSKFHERARQGKEVVAEKPEWFDRLNSMLPETCAVLFGTPKGPNDEAAVPAMSIILKVYQGKLQFTLCRQGSPDMWSGTIDDPCALQTSLEAALIAGQYVPVEKKATRGGHTGKF